MEIIPLKKLIIVFKCILNDYISGDSKIKKKININLTLHN